MQKLHLVGFTAEFDGLIFSTRKGARSGSFVVPLDARLLKQIADAERRRDGGDTRTASALEQRAPTSDRPESSLTPREMQDRLRGGWTLEEVASEAGVDPDWVARFAAPVLAEMRRVISRAREAVFDKPRVGESALPLGQSVRRNVTERGVTLTDDEVEDAWSAWQAGDDLWVVRFVYLSRGRSQEAEWLLDLEDDHLTARNRLASQLGHVTRAKSRTRPPATKRRPVARPAAASTSSGQQAAAAPAKAATERTAATKKKATPAKRAAATKKKAAAKKATAAKRAAATKKKAAAKKAAAKRVAAAKKGTTATRAAATKKKAPAKKAPARGGGAAAKKAPARATAKRAPTRRPSSARRSPATKRTGPARAAARKAPPAPIAPRRPLIQEAQPASPRWRPAAAAPPPPQVERSGAPRPPAPAEPAPEPPRIVFDDLTRGRPSAGTGEPRGPLPPPPPTPVPAQVREAVASPIGTVEADPVGPGAAVIDEDTGIARIDSRRTPHQIVPPRQPVFRDDVTRAAGPAGPPASAEAPPPTRRRREPLRGR